MSLTFKNDLEFLKKYKSVIVLSDETGRAQAALVADWQRRVVTSTADGPAEPGAKPQGPEAALSRVAQAVLGVSLGDVAAAFRSATGSH